jgi:hypothetical protein
MASKTGRKANAAAARGSNLPAEKDDGTRWIVVDASGRTVYPGSGVSKSEARRLGEGLLQDGCSLVQVG